MRSGQLFLRVGVWAVLAVGAQLAQAEETVGPGQALSSATNEVVDLKQRLNDSLRQRDDLLKQLQTFDVDHETAQLSRLRQENQKLKLQLKEAQAVAPQRILTEQQQWFVTGGGVAMIALLCGIFASGWRRQRRQWLN